MSYCASMLFIFLIHWQQFTVIRHYAMKFLNCKSCLPSMDTNLATGHICFDHLADTFNTIFFFPQDNVNSGVYD